MAVRLITPTHSEALMKMASTGVDATHTVHRADTVNLYGWVEDWAEAARPVRALLFGEMVRRATPIMQQYQSDLFHDAEWLKQHVNGPTTFEWLIRPSGTNIAPGDVPDDINSARIGVRIGPGDGAVFYRVTLRCDRGRWLADFEDIPLYEIKEGK